MPVIAHAPGCPRKGWVITGSTNIKALNPVRIEPTRVLVKTSENLSVFGPIFRVLVSTSIKRNNYYGYQIDDSPINRTRMSLTALEGQCSKTPPWKHCIHLENICVSGFSHIFRKSVYIQKAFKFQVKAPLTRPLALPSLGQAALSVCRELSQLPPRSLPFFTTSLLRRRHVFQDMVGCVDSKKLYI